MTKTDFGELMSIGVDIGKDVFHLVGFDLDGQRVLRKKIKRLALVETFEQLPRCVVGMEACLSAHFVSLKWSQKIGQPAKVYPKPLKGYENGEAPELYGSV